MSNSTTTTNKKSTKVSSKVINVEVLNANHETSLVKVSAKDKEANRKALNQFLAKQETLLPTVVDPIVATTDQVLVVEVKQQSTFSLPKVTSKNFLDVIQQVKKSETLTSSKKLELLSSIEDAREKMLNVYLSFGRKGSIGRLSVYQGQNNYSKNLSHYDSEIILTGNFCEISFSVKDGIATIARLHDLQGTMRTKNCSLASAINICGFGNLNKVLHANLHGMKATRQALVGLREIAIDPYALGLSGTIFLPDNSEIVALRATPTSKAWEFFAYVKQ